MDTVQDQAHAQLLELLVMRDRILQRMPFTNRDLEDLNTVRHGINELRELLNALKEGKLPNLQHKGDTHDRAYINR